jgi:hypothetical protein
MYVMIEAYHRFYILVFFFTVGGNGHTGESVGGDGGIRAWW